MLVLFAPVTRDTHLAPLDPAVAPCRGCFGIMMTTWEQVRRREAPSGYLLVAFVLKYCEGSVGRIELWTGLSVGDGQKKG